MATNDGISEAGRRERFERWEKLGLDRVRSDLQTDPYRRVGSQPVQDLAWEWVRLKEQAKAQAYELLAKPQAAEEPRISAAAQEALQQLPRSPAVREAEEALRQLSLSPAVTDAEAVLRQLGPSQSVMDALSGRDTSLDHLVRAAADATVSAPDIRPSPPAAKPAKESRPEVLTLKPTLYGMSIDLKEAWRRLSSWRRRRRG